METTNGVNRPILFRGKRLDNGEWIEGLFTMVKWQSCQIMENKGTWHEPIWEVRDEYKHLLKSMEANRNRYWFAAIQQSKNFDSIVNVDPDTVCQFTGLTDKNGKKIFENDIVTQPVRETRKHSPCVIEFHDGCFKAHYISEKRFFDRYYDINTFTKVIGNRFDNPELLEVTP